jgi:hypothetical protein
MTERPRRPYHASRFASTEPHQIGQAVPVGIMRDIAI